MNTMDLLFKDIEFLVPRASQAGTINFTENRDCGASSNSIVEIAYEIRHLWDQILPHDAADLNACVKMWDKLPEHRKTFDVKLAMDRALNYKQEAERS